MATSIQEGRLMIQKLHNGPGTDSMRILYDGMIYQRQAAGGINRYFEKLIGNLPSNITPIMTSSKMRMTNFPQNAKLQMHLKRFQLPRPFRKLGRAVQAARFDAVSRALKPDLVHATYYDTLGKIEKSKNGPPLVVTVHDMTHEKFPRLLDRRGKHAAIKKRAIGRADAIICVSHRTRDDLLERFPECESHTCVIYHATELGQLAPGNWRPQSDRPYFLFVGSRSSYKNFDRLLRAFQVVTAKHPEVQLRTVGSQFSKQERERIASLGLEDHVLSEGLVGDQRLAQIYRSGVALVYPSLYEGFGLPLLEAMSCGTPVMAANCSCIPEVVQDAALLFDPYSETELVAGLLSLLNDAQQRETLVEKGKIRCKDFSWSKASMQTVGVYQSLLAHEPIKDIQPIDGMGKTAGTSLEPRLAINVPMQAM
jgi:glycosyltransferase involved in cell wall biosynthesis